MKKIIIAAILLLGMMVQAQGYVTKITYLRYNLTALKTLEEVAYGKEPIPSVYKKEKGDILVLDYQNLVKIDGHSLFILQSNTGINNGIKSTEWVLDDGSQLFLFPDQNMVIWFREDRIVRYYKIYEVNYIN